MQVDGNRKRNQVNHAEQCWSLLKQNKCNLKYTQCSNFHLQIEFQILGTHNKLPDNSKGRDSIHICAPNKEDQIDPEKQTLIQYTCLKKSAKNKVHKIN